MLLRDCDFFVFKVSFTYDKIVRTPTLGGMDSEYSHTEKGVHGVALVVAPSSAIARALFEHNSTTRTIVEIETIGQVDLMMRG